MLDYFAVENSLRGKGIGGKCITLMKKIKPYQGIILEVDAPDFAQDEADKNICLRRIKFYTNNGIRLTNISESLFGAHFKLMVLDFSSKNDDDAIIKNSKKK